MADDQDAVRERQNLVEVARGEDHRRSLTRRLDDGVVDHLARPDVDAAGRLEHDEDAKIGDREVPGNDQLLLVAATESRRLKLREERLQLEPLQPRHEAPCLVGPMNEASPRKARHHRGGGVLQRRQHREQPFGMAVARHVADAEGDGSLTVAGRKDLVADRECSGGRFPRSGERRTDFEGARSDQPGDANDFARPGFDVEGRRTPMHLEAADAKHDLAGLGQVAYADMDGLAEHGVDQHVAGHAVARFGVDHGASVPEHRHVVGKGLDLLELVADEEDRGALEAAARHLSFTRAAMELNVTQGAVSRQVRDLEGFLRTQLFRRLTRRIELTEEGLEYFAVVRDMFAELERAGARGRKSAAVRHLTLSALPTIASMWLMPRLHLFTQTRRAVEVRIISSIEPADLLAHDADVAIRVGRLPGRDYPRNAARIELEMVRDWSGLHADELFPDILVPVCLPTLIEAAERGDPERVLLNPLIHTTTRRHAWPDWLKAQGLTRLDPHANAVEFGHFFMSLEAARKGKGVAIIPDIILANYERRRELVTPLPALASAGEYYLLIHESRLDEPHVQAFRRWVIAEASRARSEVSGA